MCMNGTYGLKQLFVNFGDFDLLYVNVPNLMSLYIDLF
jgi:hypothetical protein